MLKECLHHGFAFSKDNELQIDFENQFGYALTTDQQRSVDEIKLV